MAGILKEKLNLSTETFNRSGPPQCRQVTALHCKFCHCLWDNAEATVYRPTENAVTPFWQSAPHIRSLYALNIELLDSLLSRTCSCSQLQLAKEALAAL